MTDPAKDGFDIDEFFAEVKPTTAFARVCPRGDLLDRHEELSHRLQAAVLADDGRNKGHESPALAEELQALETEIEASMRTFRFQSIGRTAWLELKGEHPFFSDEGKPAVAFDKAHATYVDFDVKTFPIAAVAASSLAPRLTEAHAAKLAVELNDTQFDQLWMAAVRANVGGVTSAPKSQLASGILKLPRGDESNGSWTGGSLPASETAGDAGPLNSPSTTTPDD